MNTSGLDLGTPEGWPDAQVLERIANELFNALPKPTQARSSVRPGPGESASREDLPKREGEEFQESPISAGSLPLEGVPALPLVDLPGIDSRTGFGASSTAPALFAEAPSPWQGVGWGGVPTPPFIPPLDYPGDGTPLGGIPPSSTAAVPGPAFYFLETTPTPSGQSVPTYGEWTQVDAALAPQPGLEASTGSHPLDVPLIRRDFPILSERVAGGRRLVWLDNAATTQKPRAVIDRLSAFYEHENSNIHRAAHELAARATDAYEGAREKVRAFLGAGSSKEIVFVRGATEGINLIAQSWGRQHVSAGDEIIISWLEHHANIVPWQQLAEVTGAKLRVIPVDDDGQIILSDYAKLLNERTKIVSITHVSNALGTIVPVATVGAMAHAVGAKVLVDGAQAVSHMPVNVRAIDADWYVFSGHKVFGPTGIGVVYGKEALLNETQPWQGGGNMISDVTFERTVYHKAPARFEAGTGNIADAVGLGAAIDYVSKIGMERISQYEHQLLLYATRLLCEIPGLRLIGTAPDKAGVLSFVIDGRKTEDIGSALSKEGIAVRSGHHCAQPILRRFGVEATVRPSLAFYNDCADIDALIQALWKLTSSIQA